MPSLTEVTSGKDKSITVLLSTLSFLGTEDSGENAKGISNGFSSKTVLSEYNRQYVR